MAHTHEIDHQLKERGPKRESWGWTLPFTQHVLTSFDTLAQLLSPNDSVRVPGSRVRVPGEIRPRTKSLQQVFRSVMFFESSEDIMDGIRMKMQSLELSLEYFLNQEDVKGLLASDVEKSRQGERGKEGESEDGCFELRRGDGMDGDSDMVERRKAREMIFEKKISSVELKRRNDVLSSQKREKMLKLMRELEGRIEANAMWPRKM